MTTLQINAILVVICLAGLAAAMCYMLIAHNGQLPDARFMALVILLKDIILALIGIGWFFARRPDAPKDG